MNKPRNIWIGLVTATVLAFGHTSALAQSRVQPLALEAEDGNRITGFVLQDRSAPKDAPLAILMH